MEEYLRNELKLASSDKEKSIIAIKYINSSK